MIPQPYVNALFSLAVVGDSRDITRGPEVIRVEVAGLLVKRSPKPRSVLGGSPHDLAPSLSDGSNRLELDENYVKKSLNLLGVSF